MDFLNEMDEMLMSSSSESEDEGARQPTGRRYYRTFIRAKVEDFDNVEFRRYFRLNKDAFWRLHSLVHDSIDGDRRRLVHILDILRGPWEP